MKKISLTALMLASLVSTVSAQSKQQALELNLMDTSVRPQDDFYNYVNGTWMKTAKIPADKPSWGSFTQLRETTDNNSLGLLDNILKENFATGSEGQKIQALYQTYMDMNKRNADGLNPIKGDLAKIDGIKNLADLQKYLIDATKRGDNSFYEWGVDGDLKNSKMNAVYLGDASLGLGRDYYQKDSPKNTETIEEYKKYVAQVLTEIGYKNSAAVAGQIVDFEKKIAQTLLTNEQIRDSNLQYNPKTLPELKALVKNIDLPQYLAAVGVKTDKVIIGELGYYKNLDTFLTEKNIPLIKDYLKFNLVSGSSGYLNQKLDDMKFNFYSKYLQGQQEQRALNKRALGLINGVVGEAFGKVYVEKYFTPEAKAQMLTYIDYLKKSFGVHINGLTWMSSVTKTKALDKLNKFTVKIAYPDTWKDYSKLTLKSVKDGGTLYNNLQNVSSWHYAKELEKIGKPVDKAEWGMSPQTVNAYYNPVNNEIVFPAAILQPPFFNPNADAAVNFGGIGAVIGHEMTHGFDDSGAQFDGDGNLKDWWTAED